MKKRKISLTNALKEFESNIDSTMNFTNSLNSNILTTNIFFKKLGTDKRKNNEREQEILKHLNFAGENNDKLFEMGFIALFANFEFFMYSLLKELLQKYPKTIEKDGDKDKTVKIEDINNFSKIKDLKNYIIDQNAIENSKDINGWKNFINGKFKINIFPDIKIFHDLEILNEIRNSYMHAGGNINSKIGKKISSLLKVEIKNIGINDSLGLDKERNFKFLSLVLKTYISKLKKI